MIIILVRVIIVEDIVFGIIFINIIFGVIILLLKIIIVFKGIGGNIYKN